MNHSSSCPFCALDQRRILFENDTFAVTEDGFPISPGHTLIIPKRHTSSVFDLSPEEFILLREALHWARAHLDQAFAPDSYNLGINDGPAAGQTVGHLHIHLIPRYRGDQPDPRGGIRWIIPEKAKYWTD